MYDQVILNGRVIDPESKLDAPRNLGISGSVVQEVSDVRLAGDTTIDASGLIVAPGFIDLNSHGQNDESYRCQAMDGVTTALALEVGTADIDGWYANRHGKTLINFGACVGHVPARMAVMQDPGTLLPTGDGGHRQATEDEVKAIRKQIEGGLSRGALAVGLSIQYTPAASSWEVLEVFRAAAEHKALCYIHLRYQGAKEPASSINALEEVIAAAAITGTPIQIAHINSIGLSAAPRLLHMIAEARSKGLDVAADFYPYMAGMTMIESAMFDAGWRETLGIDYQDLQWPLTGERLSEESFERYRQKGGPVVIHIMSEEMVQEIAADPMTMVSTDGLLEKGVGHPRTAGSYSRILGRFVREAKILNWMEALRKMTLLPAQRLEERVPLMKNKGRIRPGADADLTIFDPQTVIDNATYQEPAKYSQGIRTVLLGGVPIVREGQLIHGVTPGRSIRATIG
jgi:N-acyl-D-aspartate/D-glutamate deacylase